MIWLFKPTVISRPGGWSQTMKKPDVEVPGCRGYTWSAIVRPVGRTDKWSRTTLEAAYGREINIQFSGNSSVGHSCIQHANCTLPHLWHCIVWQICTFEWHFIFPSTWCTCVMIMIFNQFLDMPHLSGGWIILANKKCSLTGCKQISAQNLREIGFLCTWSISGIFYFSSWNMGINTL